jgi:hypothetical protein
METNESIDLSDFEKRCAAFDEHFYTSNKDAIESVEELIQKSLSINSSVIVKYTTELEDVFSNITSECTVRDNVVSFRGRSGKEKKPWAVNLVSTEK